MITPLMIGPALANIFSSLGGFLTDKSFEALGALFMIVLGIFIKQEIMPLLQATRNREVAEYVLVIADDVTDYFRLKFPNAHWSVWLSQAVDRIIEVTGVGKEVADRAAKAAIARKEIPQTTTASK